jgi:uncharacterized protein (TIGR02145 family)
MKAINITTFFLSLFFLKSICYSQKTVKIGNQEWTVKNLNVEKFRNGDPIPEARNASEWKTASNNKLPAWCYYNYNSKNGKVYGKLYNWYAVNDTRGLAPKGFIIPHNSNWETLINYLGKIGTASTLSSKKEWKSLKGNNKSGFSALPGGYVTESGSHDALRYNGYWWSADEFTQANDQDVEVESDGDEELLHGSCYYIQEEENMILNSSKFKAMGFSVRCIKKGSSDN